MTRMERIGREVHVWTLDPEHAALDAALDARERERIGRLRLAGARRQRRAAAGLLRHVLSRYAPLAPAAWQFERGEYGRPALAPGQTDLDLRFNVSHTERLVVCAVAVGREIGVDVEWIPRGSRTMSIARRFFAAEEMRDLCAAPVDERRERFFTLWTLKEAYLKARGLGLRVPLRRCRFELCEAGKIRARFDAEIDDDPDAWQFACRRPTPDHVLALAVRREGGDATLRVRRWPTSGGSGTGGR